VRFRPYKIESVEASQTSPAPPVVNADYRLGGAIIRVDSAESQMGQGNLFWVPFDLSK